jgi:hypothetical protein
MTEKIVIYKDEPNNLILFSIGGKIVAKMTVSEWAFVLANPQKISADVYNFSRGDPA